MDANAPAMARISVIVALAAIGYFLIASVATHIVSTQYDLVRDYISDYAVGPYGWIYGSAFFASCVGCIALSIALWMTVPHAALSRSGVVMLAIVGISYAIDFYFPTDILQPGQPPQTRIGAIHLADAFLGWVIYVIAAFLISSRLRRDAYFGRYRRTLLALSWLALLLLVLLIVIVVTKVPVGGIVEKAFILDRNFWSLLLVIAVLAAPSLAPTRGAARTHTSNLSST